MSGEEYPSPLTEASRKYLEDFLQQVRRADLPGCDELIRKLEQTLGRGPAKEDPASDAEVDNDANDGGE